MRTLIIILLTATIVNAGRTSEWSAPFVLRERLNAIRHIPLPGAAAERFSIMLVQAPFGKTVTLSLRGVSPAHPATLRVYNINGRVVKDLSASVRAGSASVVWNTAGLLHGLFFATLRNGNRSKTVKIMLFK